MKRIIIISLCLCLMLAIAQPAHTHWYISESDVGEFALFLTSAICIGVGQHLIAEGNLYGDSAKASWGYATSTIGIGGMCIFLTLEF